MDITPSRTCFISVAALALCACATGSAFPAVLSVSLEQMSTASQLIFEGEVIGTDSRFNANETSIHTYVTFRVVDVIKGTHNRPEIILRFLGGTVGEISLDVSESTLPEFGQKGVYFVESLDRFQVNPLYGMDQGHFLIFESAGRRIMTTWNKWVITSLPPIAQTRAARWLSNGIARGVAVEEAGAASSGVTVFQFKQAIRQHFSQ